MRKSTLLLVVLALGLGGSVYYYEFKRTPTPKKAEDESNPAFSFHAEDVKSLEFARSGQTISIEKRDGKWLITQPVETRADSSVIEGIATELARARISRTLPASPDRLAAYGLTNPEVTLDLRLQNGAKHQLKLGSKDYTGGSVYAILDENKEVALLPAAILSETDKPLDDLRDRNVLDLASDDVAAFTLKGPSGEIAAVRQDSGWKLDKPRAVAADTSQVDSLLAQATSAKMTGVESEDAAHLSKYGLENPSLSFEARTKTGELRKLIFGKRAGSDYFARDTSRPMVFRTSEDFYKKLDVKFFDLRDKSLVQFEAGEVTRVEVRNGNQTIVVVQKNANEWALEQPGDNKGKAVQSWKLLDPLLEARAEEIYDQPPPSIASRLSKPAVEVTLTFKSGKSAKISVSSESGGFAYARTSDSAAVYKLSKKTSDDLNFKVSDLLI
jgi:hypothetical protein